jgi:hypothetical protein
MDRLGGWIRTRRPPPGPGEDAGGDHAAVLRAVPSGAAGETPAGVGLRVAGRTPAPAPAFAEDPASRLRRLQALRRDELVG